MSRPGPLRHTDDSANIAYYREAGGEGVWASVLRSDPLKRDAEGIIRAVPGGPTFFGSVYRPGEGLVADFTYKPKRPKPGRLSDRTVTRLVREALV